MTLRFLSQEISRYPQDTFYTATAGRRTRTDFAAGSRRFRYPTLQNAMRNFWFTIYRFTSFRYCELRFGASPGFLLQNHRAWLFALGHRYHNHQIPHHIHTHVLDEILRSILPEKLLHEIPSAFTTSGHLGAFCWIARTPGSYLQRSQHTWIYGRNISLTNISSVKLF
jgi:hypothetical protein